VLNLVNRPRRNAGVYAAVGGRGQAPWPDALPLLVSTPATVSAIASKTELAMNAIAMRSGLSRMPFATRFDHRRRGWRDSWDGSGPRAANTQRLGAVSKPTRPNELLELLELGN
jgi:hypothetical protein